MSEASIQPQARAAPRGRPPNATREEVLELALGRYLRGRRVDVQAIAGELGLGRTTVYRWFGSRDDLLGEVLVRAAEPLLEYARAGADGEGWLVLLNTLDRFNRGLMDSSAMRSFIESERDAALRVITSGAGRVQPWIAGAVTDLIWQEVRAGTYRPAIEPSTLGFAIVRLGEAFLYNDAAAGLRGDVDRLREVQGAMFAAERSADGVGA